MKCPPSPSLRRTASALASLGEGWWCLLRPGKKLPVGATVGLEGAVTATVLEKAGLKVERIFKLQEGRPNAIDLLVSGKIHMLVNTPLGKLTQQDDYAMRRAALQHRVAYTTTMSAASAACDAIIALRSRAGEVRSLQEWHELAREMTAEWAG